VPTPAASIQTNESHWNVDCFMTPGRCSGVFDVRRLASDLFSWFRFHQRQPATGIKLLAGFQHFFFAVGSICTVVVVSAVSRTTS
jgi:hypothetical protein